MLQTEEVKNSFKNDFIAFLQKIRNRLCTADQWNIKGFIDIEKQIFSISNDTKIVSKILELQLFPYLVDFSEKNGYKIKLPTHQNYYPDLTFIKRDNADIKFAVDIKTSYRLENKPEECNGFTLGSHGEYFRNRDSSKNITYPYKEYCAHFCLGIIYERVLVNELKKYLISDLNQIPSVIKNFTVFFVEKYKIASDKSGSGNTANIGSIKKIQDILDEKGIFSELGEDIFDDYWINYRQIRRSDGSLISNIKDYLEYRKIN